MDKNDFLVALKEILPEMNEEEIKTALETLNDCKPKISKKNVCEKACKARILSSIDVKEIELTCLDGGKNERKVVALGASLLMDPEFNCFKNDIPEDGRWWLHDLYYVENGKMLYNYDRVQVARIRPIIIVREMPSDMKTGDRVIINGEDFVFLAPIILLKTKCLGDSCTYNARGYFTSVIKYCVDGWYAELIKNNKTRSSSATI